MALDLVILAADKDMYSGLGGILRNSQDVGVPDLRYKILTHPNHDPGVYRRCQELLRSQLSLADRALVVFDREGCGSQQERERLEDEVETRLAQNGWNGRSAAIAIDPELEAWAWGGYGSVARVLHWPGGGEALRQWLEAKDYLRPGWAKPSRPKEALRHALHHLRVPRSPSLFSELATEFDLQACTDAAFVKFRGVLAEWFRRPDV